MIGNSRLKFKNQTPQQKTIFLLYDPDFKQK